MRECCRGICKSFYQIEGHLSDLNHEQNLPHWEHKLGLSANSTDMVLIAAQMGPPIVYG